MRKLVATLGMGLGLAIALAACGGEDANTPPPAPPVPPPADTTPPPADTTPPVATAAPAPAPSQTDKELATLKAFGTALGAHDIDGLTALYTPDAVFKFAGMPDSTRDVAMGHQKDAWASFPDSKGAARRIFVKNDVAIIEWTMTGTNTGPAPMGRPSTGKPVGIIGLTAVWFTPDGLIREQHEYMDVPTMIGQLGMGPKDMKARPPATLPDGKPEMHISKGTPDEDKNVAASQAVQKMFETHDAKSFAGASTDDVVWEDSAAPAPMNGKKAMSGYFDMMSKAVPDLKMNCTTWGVDDYVLEECEMTGTNKGSFVFPGMKTKPTNKPVDFHGFDVIQMKDGKAAHGWSYGNGMEMAMQLGMMKPPKDKGTAAAAQTTAKPPSK
jgi:ketosteroid isomerase-like protein